MMPVVTACKRYALWQGYCRGIAMQSVLCRIVLLLLTGFFSLASGAQEYAFLHRHELALNKRLLQQQQAPDLTVAAWRRLRV